MRIKVDKLDKLFSQYIRQRDVVCQRCGGTSGLQNSHFHGRRKASTRHNEDNACLLCYGCHMYFHANPLEHTEWFRERVGETKFMLLNIQANQVGKVDRQAVELYLRNLLEDHPASGTKYSHVQWLQRRK